MNGAHTSSSAVFWNWICQTNSHFGRCTFSTGRSGGEEWGSPGFRKTIYCTTLRERESRQYISQATFVPLRDILSSLEIILLPACSQLETLSTPHMCSQPAVRNTYLTFIVSWASFILVSCLWLLVSFEVQRRCWQPSCSPWCWWCSHSVSCWAWRNVALGLVSGMDLEEKCSWVKRLSRPPGGETGELFY